MGPGTFIAFGLKIVKQMHARVYMYVSVCILTVPVADIPQLPLERHCLVCTDRYSNTWQLFHGFHVGFMNGIQGQSINTR